MKEIKEMFQYCQNVSSSQLSLCIWCNPNQNLSKLFCGHTHILLYMPRLYLLYHKKLLAMIASVSEESDIWGNYLLNFLRLLNFVLYTCYIDKTFKLENNLCKFTHVVRYKKGLNPGILNSTVGERSFFLCRMIVTERMERTVWFVETVPSYGVWMLSWRSWMIV